MSKDKQAAGASDASSRLIGRRAVLEGSALGGAVLAAGLFGPLTGSPLRASQRCRGRRNR